MRKFVYVVRSRYVTTLRQTAWPGGIQSLENINIENNPFFLDEITLTDDQETEPFGIARSGLKDVQYRWPKNTVPYLLDAGDFDGLEKENIKLTLKSIEKVTCVKFIPRTNEKNYVHVTVSIFDIVLAICIKSGNAKRINF